MNRATVTMAALLMSASSAAYAQTPAKPAPVLAPAPAPHAAATASGTKAQTAATATPADANSQFVDVVNQEDLSSKIVGLSIYNSDKQDLGTIKDIAFGPQGVTAYIVGIGGVLGMGDHYIAVHPSAVKIGLDPTDNKWHATMNATTASLKAAPEFKYTSKG